MVNFTMDQIQPLLNKAANVRNVSIFGYIDHGKKDLIDTLVQSAGIFPSANNESARCIETCQDEKDGCNSFNSTAISMHFELPEEKMKDVKQESDGSEFLINLIDLPDHVELTSQVTTMLRATDGALVVVDCVDNVRSQTESVLRQAICERIKPVLMINKVDHALQELRLNKEELYEILHFTIERFNEIIDSYADDESLGEWQVHPEKGTVAFGSGLHGWGFTLRQFADRYAKKFGVDKKKMMERLWGENYFNPNTKEWSAERSDAKGKPLERGFNLFILVPIFRFFDSIMNLKKERTITLLNHLEITLNNDEKDLDGEALLKVVMRKFLPAADSILEMIVIDLPSPVTAQKYRAEIMYEGPTNNKFFESIRNCDKDGPLMIYVSKMVPTSVKGRFYAFGRVFSGTVRPGLKVRILGPNYKTGKKEDLFVKSIESAVLMTGPYIEPIQDCPAGNLVGLVGVDQFLLGSGTITSDENAHNLKVSKFSVSPVVRVSVNIKKADHLPMLVEGLKRLSKSDPCVQCFINNTGEHIIGGASEMHLKSCLKHLEKDLNEKLTGAPIRTGTPYVSYCETVLAESSQVCLSQSHNGHNRIFMKAQSISMDLAQEIEDGKIALDDNAHGRHLEENYSWDVTDTRNIWCFGPNNTGSNVLVNQTKDVKYLNEIKDSCVAAVQWATKEGVLCGENMRACRFNILDAILHADAIHRGSGQIIPTCRRAIYNSVLSADPHLLEPIYMVEIQSPMNAKGDIYSFLLARQGRILQEGQRPGMSIRIIKAYLPVSESFGLAEDLRLLTHGKATAQAVFDHWQLMDGSPLVVGSKVENIVKELRKLKGLGTEIPAIDHFR